jgi:serine protease Do
MKPQPAGTVLALLLALASTPAAAQNPRRSPVVDIVERISPAVVNVAAEAMVREVDPFFGGIFGGRQRRTQSLGSGLIVEASGLVVTNAHVIEGASRIVVTMLDGRELEADVLGSDRDADLAVLKVQGAKLPAVPLGSSGDLWIGETVVAIGNPFGLSHSVTTGVLSARGRAVPSERGERIFTDFLQTDASINPGNSGGPLANLNGDVIGINTAVISGANGIGFAIPADRARRIVDELQPLWTGLRLTTIDAELAGRDALPVTRGALVEQVFPGSPGARAGLLAGDAIVSVSGQPVAAREDVTSALYSVPAGNDISVQLRRGEQTLSVRLRAERPPEGLGVRILQDTLGLTVDEERGALVIAAVRRDSRAAEKGLRPGDRVLSANGQTLASREALGREVLRGMDRGGVLLVIQRGRYAYNIGFEL